MIEHQNRFYKEAYWPPSHKSPQPRSQGRHCLSPHRRETLGTRLKSPLARYAIFCHKA